MEQYFDYIRDKLRIFNEFSGEKSSKILSYIRTEFMCKISCVINREIKFQSEENMYLKKREKSTRNDNIKRVIIYEFVYRVCNVRIMKIIVNWLLQRHRQENNN